MCNRRFLSASRSSSSLGEGEHQTCATQSAKDSISSGINAVNSLQLKLFFLASVMYYNANRFCCSVQVMLLNIKSNLFSTLTFNTGVAISL